MRRKFKRDRLDWRRLFERLCAAIMLYLMCAGVVFTAIMLNEWLG